MASNRFRLKVKSWLSEQNVIVLSLSALLLALAVYLFATHYVMAYSDACGWLIYAKQMLAGHPTTRRAFGYPIFLIAALKFLGPFWVFLANLPLVVFMAWLLAATTERCANHARESSNIPKFIGLLAACIMIVTNRWMLVYLVNPYREALAFSLLFGGIITLMFFFTQRGLWKAFLAALLFGLSISVRETCGIILPLAFLFFVHKYIKSRDKYWLKGALCFSCLFLVGLIPFFIQNCMHTGHWWLPAYAAVRVISDNKLHLPTDIPVPGMKFSYFATIGREILCHMYAKYTWLGMLALVSGIVVSIRKKLYFATHLLLPFALLNLLFYACYHYFVPRYLFVVDLSLIPIMAIGLYYIVHAAAQVTRRVFAKRQPAKTLPFSSLLSPCVVGLVIWILASSHHGHEPVMKVWHLRPIRNFLVERIERPCFFLGQKHHRQLLSWILQQPLAVFETEIPSRAYLKSGSVMGLAVIRDKWTQKITDSNYYFVGPQPDPFLKNWFDFTPVVSLKDSPAPLVIYGSQLKDTLYSIKPWSQNEILISRNINRTWDKCLLLLDCYQLWDNPDRTHCHLFVNSAMVEDKVPSGLHFVQLDECLTDDGTLDIRIESDYPLPLDPVLEIYPMGSEIQLALGAGPRSWHFPLLSRSLTSLAPFKQDACILGNEGRIHVPSFADRNEIVLAEFHIEFLRNSHQLPGRQFIALSTQYSSVTNELPSPRTSADVVVSLGRGTGRLEMVPVKLDTTLPALSSYSKGTTPAFVKIYGVRVMSFSPTKGGFVIDVGSQQDAPYIVEGFYEREKSTTVPDIRWSAHHGKIRIPIQKPTSVAAIDIKSFQCRPPEAPATPEFLFNGIPVSEDYLTILDQNNRTTYSLSLGPERFRDDCNNTLSIVTETWNPSEAIGVDDSRDLGIMIDTISVNLDAGPP